MKSKLSDRIRRFRENSNYTRKNMAAELGITASAYSKIERGDTDPSIGRMEQIAKIVGVALGDFFQQEDPPSKVADSTALYGFATKGDLEELNKMVNHLQNELSSLKKEFAATIHQMQNRKSSQPVKVNPPGSKKRGKQPTPTSKGRS